MLRRTCRRLVGRALDLRSDTVTLPSLAVRAAAARAEVGDDVYGEDPSANRLERRVASLLGKSHGLLLPTQTMANIVALGATVPRGATVLCDVESHLYEYENGGASVLLGLPLRPVARGEGSGELCLAALEAAMSAEEDIHVPSIGAVCLENTHAASGGRPLSPSYVAAVGLLCARFGVPLHVDGARLVNAAEATRGTDPLTTALERLTGPASTVALCLSKGLGAPAGAVLVSDDAKVIAAARKHRKLLGGGMRQVGVLAAAAEAALDENLYRLGEDHAAAAALRQHLAAIPSLEVSGETNFVMISTPAPAELIARAREQGVHIGAGYRQGELRAVTHLGVDEADIARVANVVRSVLDPAAPAQSKEAWVPPPLAVVACVDEEKVTLRWPDGHVSQFLLPWLRDHCPQSTNATSRQRMVDSAHLPSTVEQVQVAGDELRIDWAEPVTLLSGGEVSQSLFPLAWLRDRCYSHAARHERAQRWPDRTLWGGDHAVPTVDHDAWQGEGFRDAMADLYRMGALVVRGVPLDQTRDASERIGHIRTTFYGTMWDTAAKSEEEVNDMAFTNFGLPPHNDTCYLSVPAGVQVFHCAEQSAQGGRTILVDGFAVAERLRQDDPAAFHFFSTTPIPTMCIEPDVHVKSRAPVITLDEASRVVGFRLNTEDRDCLHDLPAATIRAFYRHLPSLLSLCRDPRHGVFLQLAVGDFLLVENRRTMHARTAFQGSRVLQGCYIDTDQYESRLRLLDIIQ